MDFDAIVADIGTQNCRIGFAGDDHPKALFPSVAGVTTDKSSERKLHWDVHKFHEYMKIETPLRDGVIEDWALWEKMVQHGLSQVLKADIEETPILIAEKPYNTSATRQKTAEIIFEKFKSSALFLAKDAVLSCYACGKTSGLVVDLGAAGSVVSPVQDGWVDARAVTRSPVGGRVLDAYIHQLVSQQGGELRDQIRPLFRVKKTALADGGLRVEERQFVPGAVAESMEAWQRLEAGRQLKEAVCRVVEGPVPLHLPLLPYQLPDGTPLDVGPERFQLPELLFDPSPLLQTPPPLLALLQAPLQAPPSHLHRWAGLPQLVQESLSRVDPDQLPGLLACPLVVGGGALTDGLDQRLRAELERLQLLGGGRKGSQGAQAGERAHAAWLGGSIVGSLGAFHDLWLARAEYDEWGPAIVDRKCP
mmetsp:Transcript_11786/g.16200  ORF Transcript_11786/g.16200 Transcript_11786/m.16200 type:complete len:420 (+) Transcript_11786:1126-2385(+)